jgi:hypothetical protein
VKVGSVASRGGAGGDGGEGGNGGSGGFGVTLSGDSFVVADSIDLSGGNAGTSSNPTPFDTPGSGGSGGFLFNIRSGNGSVSIGKLVARGGAGSNWTSASGMDGTSGGDGGEGSISALTSITLGGQPPIGQSTTVIDLSGGAGGNGGGGGNGGAGGSGGSLTLDPISMTINGVLVATGGAGGAGATQGVGGNGGGITFATTGGTGNITFVNGGWDLSAGAGGTINGFISGAGTIPAQLDVTKFVWIGPGDMADIPVTGVGIFRFTSISDPLSNPAVLQQVGFNQQQAQDVAEGTGDGSTTEKEEKDKEKTGSLGSCRPS